jgi:hypothetical protein
MEHLGQGVPNLRTRSPSGGEGGPGRGALVKYQSIGCLRTFLSVRVATDVKGYGGAKSFGYP